MATLFSLFLTGETTWDLYILFKFFLKTESDSLFSSFLSSYFMQLKKLNNTFHTLPGNFFS